MYIDIQKKANMLFRFLKKWWHVNSQRIIYTPPLTLITLVYIHVRRVSNEKETHYSIQTLTRHSRIHYTGC